MVLYIIKLAKFSVHLQLSNFKSILNFQNYKLDNSEFPTSWSLCFMHIRLFSVPVTHQALPAQDSAFTLPCAGSSPLGLLSGGTPFIT